MMIYLQTLESEDDRRKFAEIYRQYHDQMERVAMNILRNQKDAEDAVQNAFAQVVKHFEKIFEIPCEKLPFWLISIVKNEALGILRKRRDTAPLEEWSENLADSAAGGAEDYAALVELFRRLPDTYRAVLEMKYLIGYTDREIARKLGISETAVSTRASRARALLREILEKEGYSI